MLPLDLTTTHSLLRISQFTLGNIQYKLIYHFRITVFLHFLLPLLSLLYQESYGWWSSQKPLAWNMGCELNVSNRYLFSFQKHNLLATFHLHPNLPEDLWCSQHF